HCFKLWATSCDEILAGLCRGLLFRGLYKTIDLTHVADEAMVRERVAAAERAVAAAGGEPAYEMFYDEPADTPYEVYRADQDGVGTEILVRDAAGKLTPFAAISPMTQVLNRQLMFRRVHFAAKCKDVLGPILTS
ncbi:MAG: hypothetical protein ACREIT_11895, partial [Tepidisphaeraceae bacterium]